MAKKKEIMVIQEEKTKTIRKSKKNSKSGNIFDNINQVRIMMRILEAIQPDLEKYAQGSQTQQLELLEENFSESLEIILPFKHFSDESHNYFIFMEALREMQKTVISFENKKSGGILQVSLLSDIYYSGEEEVHHKTITIRINIHVVHFLLDLRFGFSKIDTYWKPLPILSP